MAITTLKVNAKGRDLPRDEVEPFGEDRERAYEQQVSTVRSCLRCKRIVEEG